MIEVKIKKLNKSKRHHYLPQFYLEYFCINGCLWLFDKKNKEYRIQTPINTTLKSYYYSLEDEKGQKGAQIESFLSKIEGFAKPIIQKINSGNNITSEEKEKLSIFIAFMMNRVPEFEKSVNDIENHLIKKFAKFIFSDEKRTQAILDRYDKSTGTKDDTNVKEVMEFFKSNNFDIEVPRSESLRLMVELSIELAAYFTQMDWVFYHAPQKASFVTTDNPVIIVPPKNRKNFYSRGITTPGARKIFPLSQSACLIMYDHGDIAKHVKINEETTQEISSLISLSF
ncbi:MAG: DUF4238 domain-containing protein [bacterium]